MLLADVTVPKRNPADGKGYGEDGGFSFCPSGECAARFAERTAGKILLVLDKKSCAALSFASRMPRVMTVVIEGNALPLFSMPDVVGGVLAAGGADTLKSARLLAKVRRTPCMLLPAESAFDGVFCKEGEVGLDGEKLSFPLAEAEVCVDRALIAPSLAEGYARLLLDRLALFEQRALSIFDRTPAPSERRYALLADLNGIGAEEILQKNAALRRTEGDGIGEGIVLARRSSSFGAFCALTALYTAFFRCGQPRHYVVADYAARARRAGVPPVLPPTEEDFTRRSLALGGRRAEFLRELGFITRNMATYRRNYLSFGGKEEKVPPAELSALPERAAGLSAVVRDFGLLEEL